MTTATIITLNDPNEPPERVESSRRTNPNRTERRTTERQSINRTERLKRTNMNPNEIRQIAIETGAPELNDLYLDALVDYSVLTFWDE